MIAPRPSLLGGGSHREQHPNFTAEVKSDSDTSQTLNPPWTVFETENDSNHHQTHFIWGLQHTPQNAVKQVYVHYLATSETVFDLQDLAATVYQDTPTLIVVNRFSGKDYVKTVNNPFAGAGNIKVINTLTSITGASGFFPLQPAVDAVRSKLAAVGNRFVWVYTEGSATQGSATHLRSCKYDLNAWNCGSATEINNEEGWALVDVQARAHHPDPNQQPPLATLHEVAVLYEEGGSETSFGFLLCSNFDGSAGPNCDRDIYVGVGESARFALHPQNSRLTTAVQHAAPQAEEPDPGERQYIFTDWEWQDEQSENVPQSNGAGFEWILPHPVDETGLTFQFSHSGTLVVGSLTGDPPGEAPVHTVVRSDPDSIEMPLPDNLHENAFPPHAVLVFLQGGH